MRSWSGGSGAFNVHAQLFRLLCELRIQVPHHFNVVRDEPYGTHNGRWITRGVNISDVVYDVRFQPRHVLRTGPGLPDHIELCDSQLLSHQSCGFLNLA